MVIRAKVGTMVIMGKSRNHGHHGRKVGTTGHHGHKGMVTSVGSFLCLIFGGGSGMVMDNKCCNGKFNLARLI